jgi:serine/threonine-protein kinase
MPQTEAGVILGTASYMSPEQTKGKPVDQRSDIYAFGAVLYEMLTGARLYRGESTTEILASVIKEEPRWDTVPVQVRRVLRKCLEKDPQKRLRHIGDVMELVESGASSEIVTSSQAARPTPAVWLGVVIVLVVAAGVASWIAYRGSTRPAELKPLVRLEMDLGNDVPGPVDPGTVAVLSPGGTRLVYMARSRLFTRRLDQSKATELAGTQGAYNPFFSPDGQWVGFFANAAVIKVSIEGVTPATVCASVSGAMYSAGGTWGEDGNIIAALPPAVFLSQCPAAGGQPTPLTQLANGEVSHRWPQILPGGKAVVFTAGSSSTGVDGASIEVMSLADRRVKTLQRRGTFGRYVAVSKSAGYLTYVNNGTLFAAPFDPNALELRGAPVPVLERVAYSPLWGSARVDISAAPGAGTLIYRRGDVGGSNTRLTTVQWLDSAGKLQPLLAKPGGYYTPRLSPDGRRLALTVREGSSGDIWVYEPQRDTMTRLTFNGSSQNPAWSPDGRYIAYEGRGGMFWTRSDGAGMPQPLTHGNGRQIPYSFTPDGSRLAFFTVATGEQGLMTVPVKTTGDGLSAAMPEPFLVSSWVLRHPALSPDGHWIAYSSGESGSYEIYVRAFPDKGGKWEISNSGGVYPAWSRNGHQPFYRNAENRLMAASAYTAKGDSFAADKPRLWAQQQIPTQASTGPLTIQVPTAALRR